MKRAPEIQFSTESRLLKRLCRRVAHLRLRHITKSLKVDSYHTGPQRSPRRYAAHGPRRISFPALYTARGPFNHRRSPHGPARRSLTAVPDEEDISSPHVDVSTNGEKNHKAEVTKTQQWKALLSCALQAFWVMGLSQSFGIFQAHYGSEKAVEDGIIRPQDMTQRAAIACIGSLGNGGIVAVFAMLFFPWLPQIGSHIKTACFGGTVLMAIGYASAGTCKLWQLLVTQGLLVGMGGGTLLNSLTTILPEYFGARSGLAQGASMGSGCIGGLVLSLSLPRLIEAVGSRWTLGIMSILTLCILCAASALAQPPRECAKRNTDIVGWRTFKNPIFTLLFLVNLIHPLTLAIPTTFGPEFSEALGYDVRMASVFLAITSIVGLPSRFLMGFGADFVGHTNMLFLATATFALSTFVLWLPAALISNGTVWIIFNAVYGVVYGVFQTVVNSVQKELFGDELYYPYNGAMTSIRGLGYVIGVPIAGSLVSRVKDTELGGDDFVRPIVYTGVLLAGSTICLAGVRGVDALKSGKWQWIK